MLTRLTPEQISKFWDVIKYAVEDSLPPTVSDHPDKMNRILSSALSGKTDVWASYTKNEKGNNFEGIGLTRILYDDASGTKSFLLYCMYGYNKIDESSWVPVFDKLTKYAKSKGCSRIVAYSSVPHIIKMSKMLGAETDYTFISFDLNKTV